MQITAMSMNTIWPSGLNHLKPENEAMLSNEAMKISDIPVIAFVLFLAEIEKYTPNPNIRALNTI